METLVGLYNVDMGYGDWGSEVKPILRSISLEVGRGEIVAIVGESGCGKSTLIKAVVGLLPPLSGRVDVFGRDLFSGELAGEELRKHRSRVGMLFQGGALLGSMTVADNVALPLREHTSLPDRVISRVARVKLDMVGLGGKGSLFPSELSGGMRKRASLARAIALDPEVLVCDEPSSGLDPVVAAGLDKLLLSLRDGLGMTMIVVTHDLASAKILADRIIMLGDGGILAEGTYDQLASSPLNTVRAFFNREARV